MIFFSFALLSDAEVLEDVAEDFVGGDFAAGDFGEMEEGFAEILRDEVAAESHGEGGGYSLQTFAGSAEGGVVTGVGDDEVAIGGGEARGFVDETWVEGGEAYAVECLELGRLVGDADDDLVFACFDVGKFYSGLGEQDDDLCAFHGLQTALYAETLDGVVGVADAGGIDEAEGVAAEHDGVFDDVARGALDVADDGAVFL